MKIIDVNPAAAAVPPRCSSSWSYPQEFYGALSAQRRKLFHGFVFDPPEYRFI